MLQGNCDASRFRRWFMQPATFGTDTNSGFSSEWTGMLHVHSGFVAALPAMSSPNQTRQSNPVHNNTKIQGFIFDLDGTLVDSGLDFDAMRREMGLPAKAAILEEIARMDAARARQCEQILDRHELEGATRAKPIPGALEFIRHIDRLGLKRALLTRNSRSMTLLTTKYCDMPFELMMTREDGPAKPHPWAISQICSSWELNPKQVVMIGDFRFDMEAGKAAGVRTVYFTRSRDRASLSGIELADHVLEDFEESGRLLRALHLAPLPGESF